MKYPPLIVILGPTASGKSDIALALASEINGEIVSADSRQIYKYLDIGSAKPSRKDREKVPHHLVDIINVFDDFNLNDFQELCLDAIYDIYSRDKRPVMAGGSALYIRSVTEGLELPVTPSDEQFRKDMKDLAVKEGINYLYNKLKETDPLSAEKIHHNDLRRIIRALEVYNSTSESIRVHQEKRKEVPFKSIKIGINWNRELLYKRINDRVDIMFEQGLLEETRFLIGKGYYFGSPPLDALGYPETADYLYGRTTLEETIRLIKRNTRHFSKRQLTWFRKDKDIIWLDPGKELNIMKMVEEIKKILTL